jgi:hypothetical protein
MKTARLWIDRPIATKGEEPILLVQLKDLL